MRILRNDRYARAPSRSTRELTPDAQTREDDDDDVATREEGQTVSNGTAGILLTFGESMIRFAPLDETLPATATLPSRSPSCVALAAMSSIGAVALSKLGERTRWISVVPQGPMGDVVVESGTANGVTVAGPRPATGDVGTFTVLPEAKTVHYQRRNGAFALHDPATLDWPTLLGGLDGARPWLHMTGITPMVSPAARQSWDAAIGAAAAAGIPMSLDLNHRKQLGTLAELGDRGAACREVLRHYPVARAAQWPVCASESGVGGLEPPDRGRRGRRGRHRGNEGATFAYESRGTRALPQDARRGDGCAAAVEPGRQVRRRGFTRWSSGPTSASFSTYETPVWHRPKDERRRLGVGGRVHPRRPLRERHEAARAGDAPRRPSRRPLPGERRRLLARHGGRARGGGGVVRGEGGAAPRRRRRRGAGGGGARAGGGAARDRGDARGAAVGRARSRSCAPRGRRRRRWRAASSSPCARLRGRWR